jgi:CRP-like cAMP-binding protein
MDRSIYLRKLNQFRELSNQDERLLQKAIIRIGHFMPRMDIVVRGDRPEFVHVLLEGWAARYKILSDGERHIMAYLIPGDFCDSHVAMLDRMDHSIAAVSRCRIGLIPLSAMEKMLEQSRSLSRALNWSMLVDEAILREWLVNIGARSADQRTAHFICEMFLRCSTVGLVADDSFELPLSQQQLADTMGLSLVHMNRTLKNLRRENMIRIDGSRITIVNLDALMDFADFDRLYLHQGNTLSNTRD